MDKIRKNLLRWLNVYVNWDSDSICDYCEEKFPILHRDYKIFYFKKYQDDILETLEKESDFDIKFFQKINPKIIPEFLVELTYSGKFEELDYEVFIDEEEYRDFFLEYIEKFSTEELINIPIYLCAKEWGLEKVNPEQLLDFMKKKMEEINQEYGKNIF